VLVPLLLAALVWWQTSLVRATTSAVFDETSYLSIALDLFHHGRLARAEDSAVAPLPVMVAYWLPARSISSDRVAPPEFAHAVFQARIAQAVLVGLPLVLLPYCWMVRRRGLLAASVVGALLVWSPNILAFSAVATTDACFVVTSLGALAAIDAYLQHSTWRRFVVAGIVTGIALAAKNSALFLIPVVFVALAFAACRRVPRSPGGWTRGVGGAAAHTVGFAVVALVAAWAIYGFGMTQVLDNNWTPPASIRGPIGDVVKYVGMMRLPSPLRGIVGQLMHSRGGQPAFLMGQRSIRGWWSYFPLAFLFKSTPAELLLAATLPCLLWFTRKNLDVPLRLLLLSLGFVGVTLVSSSLDIGIRHALIVYPMLILLAVDCASRVCARHPRAFAAVAASLVALQCASAVSTAPRYLSYFNARFTPAGQGYTRLADSNLDWGQDLPTLKKALTSRATDRALLAYFGAAPPLAYGIHAVPWNAPDERAVSACRWVAISATLLDGVYLRWDPFQEFRGLTPDARVADSLFLYDSQLVEVRRALTRARSFIAAQPCPPGATTQSPGDLQYGVISPWYIRCSSQ
jgi:hypothetical protein